jgi:hypothetical protein
MLAEITLDGTLEITPGSITELYAMEILIKNNWRLQDDALCINDRYFRENIITTEDEIPPVVEKEISVDDVPF